MHSINMAIAELIKSFGFHINTKDNTLQLFWGLYTQGSGVAFSGSLDDFKPLLELMQNEGQLAEAIRGKDLMANHGLSFLVNQNDHRYTHAQTMDVEADGPSSDFDDAERVAEIIEQMTAAITQLKDQASEAAHELLSDYCLLPIHQDVVIRTYTTKRFKVELIIAAPCNESWDSALEWELDGREPAEALEVMRAYSAVHGEYASYNYRVVVHERECPDEEWWDEVAVQEIAGGINPAAGMKTDLRPLWELAKETIAEVRESLELNKNQLLEAA